MTTVFQCCVVVRRWIGIQNTDQDRNDVRQLQPGGILRRDVRSGGRAAPGGARADPGDLRIAQGEIERRQRSAERAPMAMGITFNVYGDDEGTERIFPFDLIPRIVSAGEWRTIERGLKQRIRALNLFIDDIYHERRIVKDGVIPAHVLETAASLRAPCAGAESPAWHLVPCPGHGPGPAFCRPGVRARGQPPLSVRRLLRPPEPERDEAQVPAGLQRVTQPAGGRLPEPAARHVRVPRARARRVAAGGRATPGPYNSAYFEHSFLAQ